MKKSTRRSRRPRSARRNGCSLDLLAETIARCQHIITLARLLAQSGHVRQAEPVAPQLIGHTGEIIAAEGRAVAAFLQQLELH